MPATLFSSGGVVTIDLNSNLSDFYRVSTTENITSWVIANPTDGAGFIIRVTRNTGHTVAWTGLVDVWTNGPPTLNVGQSIYFPLVRDGSSWIGESLPTVSSNPALFQQAITHSTNGVVTINAENGHTAEITLTANITDHTISNHIDGQVVAVYYKASGATRTVDFGPATKVFPLANPGVVSLTANQVYRATWIRQFGATYLLDAERVT